MFTIIQPTAIISSTQLFTPTSQPEQGIFLIVPLSISLTLVLVLTASLVVIIIVAVAIILKRRHIIKRYMGINCTHINFTDF